jgi:hypothetical protein
MIDIGSRIFFGLFYNFDLELSISIVILDSISQTHSILNVILIYFQDWVGTKCCQFNQTGYKVCYSEDIQTKKSVFMHDYFDDETTPAPTAGSKVIHDEFLPESSFKNYDEFYYYEDDDSEVTNTRPKRSMSVDLRGRKCHADTNCCDCLDKSIGLDETQFRQFYKYFLTDNPNEQCPKSGHAAYVDAVRIKPITEGDLPEYMVSASNFMAFHTILRTSKVILSLNYFRRL